MGNKKPCFRRGKQGWKSYGSYDRITCLPKVYRGCYTRPDVVSCLPIDSG